MSQRISVVLRECVVGTFLQHNLGGRLNVTEILAHYPSAMPPLLRFPVGAMLPLLVSDACVTWDQQALPCGRQFCCIFMYCD